MAGGPRSFDRGAAGFRSRRAEAALHDARDVLFLVPGLAFDPGAVGWDGAGDYYDRPCPPSTRRCESASR